MLVTIAIVIVLIIIIGGRRKRKEQNYQSQKTPQTNPQKKASQKEEPEMDAQEMLDFLNDLSPDQIEMLKGNVKVDQADRKDFSIEFCEDHNIPYIDHLPFYPSEGSVTLKSKEEIIHRMMALFYFVFAAEGADEEQLAKFDKHFQGKQYLSPKEQKYLQTENPPEIDTVSAVWRYESLFVFMWALGYEEELPYPSDMCNPPEMIQRVMEQGLEGFTENAEVRPVSEIMDEADLFYRIHWACVNARVKQEPTPANLNPSVVWERRYALNWLISLDDADWDDVPLDT